MIPNLKDYQIRKRMEWEYFIVPKGLMFPSIHFLDLRKAEREVQAVLISRLLFGPSRHNPSLTTLATETILDNFSAFAFEMTTPVEVRTVIV